MKIVLVTRLFAPEVAAAAFRLKALADGLAAAGHQVTVLTTKPPANAGTASFDDYTVKRWPVLRDAGGNVRGYVQYASYDFPMVARLLVRSADVVVSEPPPTTGALAALVCLVRRKPLYYYAADIWSDALVAINAPSYVSGLMRAFEKFALRRARGVIAVSDGVAERARALGARNVEVVANGVDTALFHPVESAAPDSAPYFVYTGTMSEWQGSDVFVRAMPAVLRKHPKAKLRFFGQGSAETSLRALASSLAAEAVEFGGVVPPAEAARWISGAAGALVSIVPGQGYDFAKPTKIYAAAACGTPVLFAGVGASASMVSDNELGLVAEHTPDAVAAQMIAMLDGTRPDGDPLVAWVRDNASLATTGEVAARWITTDVAAR
ncbi:MAG TPA: glycosyltransferase family 4 protein [Actinophytocola sp.]|jgi:glycosyltransferase involved in cell wall biosynthesis|nr:glycosyltransferase family 4 protein [Actinophytocola sp.]